MVTVGRGGSHDAILRDLPTGGSTEVGLRLARDKQGRPRWQRRRLAGQPQRRLEGPLTYSDLYPGIALVHSQNDWSGGGLQPVYDPSFPNRHAFANGIDARWKNVLALGMKMDGAIAFDVSNDGLVNGDFETGDATGWSVSGGNMVVDANSARNGSYGLSWDSPASPQTLSQSIANAPMYMGKSVTLTFYVQVPGGTGGGTTTMRANIIDSAGTTNGASVAFQAATAWTAVTVTRTVAGPNFLTAQLETVTVSGYDSAPSAILVDDVAMTVTEITGFVAAPLDYLVRNGGGERGATTGWSAGGGGTLTVQTSDAPRTGTYHFRLASAATGHAMTQSLANPTVYRSREITVYAYMKRGSSGTATGRISLSDGVGTTNGTGVALTTNYQLVSVTRTIDASATEVTISVNLSAAATTPNVFIDDVFVVPTGGVSCAGAEQFANAWYAITGRVVAKWDETNDVWDAVHIHATAVATDIQQYNTYLLVAFGGGDNAYIYSTDGATWVTSTLADDAKHAHFLAVSRGTLWKTRFDGGGIHAYVNSSTAPENTTGSWGTEATVGSTDRAITGLYDFRDTVVIGKQDGLHIYNRVVDDDAEAATFVNVTNQFRHFADADNFANGAEYRNQIYLTATQQNFMRWSGAGDIQNLTSLLWSPRLNDFGGQVRKMAFCATQLWLLVDTPTADTTDSKETWLMSLLEDTDGLRVHPVQKVGIGDITHLDANNDDLWAFGRLYDTSAATYRSAIHRWDIPDKAIAPFIDTTPLLMPWGAITMAKMDWNLPTQQKAFIKLELFCKDSVLDAQHTIVVKYKVDEGSSITLGTISASDGNNHKTLYFNTVSAPQTNAVGKSIELTFEMTTDDGVSPEIWAYAIHAVYQPESRKAIDLWVSVGESVSTKGGAPGGDTKAAVLTDLETLEDATWPIELTEDWDEDNTSTTMRCVIERGSIQRVPEMETDARLEVYRLTLVEQPLA